MLSLGQAATAAGVSKSTLSRSIKSGPVRVGHLQGCVITLPDLLRGEAMPRPFLLRYFELLAHFSCSE
jgi:hypothetical protein